MTYFGGGVKIQLWEVLFKVAHIELYSLIYSEKTDVIISEYRKM